MLSVSWYVWLCAALLFGLCTWFFLRERERYTDIQLRAQQPLPSHHGKPCPAGQRRGAMDSHHTSRTLRLSRYQEAVVAAPEEIEV